MIESGRWYALQVRSRAELAVARQIDQKGYQPFVPLWRSKRRWADRSRVVELPLFPSYVFCRVTGASAGRIVTTPGVIRIVAAGGVPLPVDEAEIEALRRVVHAAAPVEPWPHIGLGARVEVGAGPLRGIQGVLTQVTNGRRLIVSVSLLQRSVAVEIDGHDVWPVC